MWTADFKFELGSRDGECCCAFFDVCKGAARACNANPPIDHTLLTTATAPKLF